MCRSSFQNTKYNKADNAYASHVVTIFYFNLVRLDGMEIKLSSRQKQEEFEIVIFSWRQMKKAEKYEAPAASVLSVMRQLTLGTQEFGLFGDGS